MSKKAVLLLNVGSPDSPKPKDVARYLRQFLMDPDIITLPWIFRAPLVYGVIVPRRHQSSAEKYEQVWTQNGSPLIVGSREFQINLQKELQESNVIVELAMSFGEPNLPDALLKLKEQNVTEILICPLFPQFAQATTGASFKAVDENLKRMKWKVGTKKLPPFFQQDFFISAFARKIQSLSPTETDQILFSFHGLPESQVRIVAGCLQTSSCCESAQACALNCYRAQCFATAQKLASRLNLRKGQWSVSFQSRLGRAKWIGPSTDETTLELANKGVKRLIVACPSFVTDCLETLEEIGIGLRKDFLTAGGEEFQLAECPNSESEWSAGFALYVKSLLEIEHEERQIHPF